MILQIVKDFALGVNNIRYIAVYVRVSLAEIHLQT